MLRTKQARQVNSVFIRLGANKTSLIKKGIKDVEVMGVHLFSMNYSRILLCEGDIV